MKSKTKSCITKYCSQSKDSVPSVPSNKTINTLKPISRDHIVKIQLKTWSSSSEMMYLAIPKSKWFSPITTLLKLILSNYCSFKFKIKSSLFGSSLFWLSSLKNLQINWMMMTNKSCLEHWEITNDLLWSINALQFWLSTLRTILKHNTSKKLIINSWSSLFCWSKTYFKFQIPQLMGKLFIIIFLPHSFDKKCSIHFCIWFKMKKDRLWTKLIFHLWKSFTIPLLVLTLTFCIKRMTRVSHFINLLCNWNSIKKALRLGIQDFYPTLCKSLMLVSIESFINSAISKNPSWTRGKFPKELLS